MKSLITLLASVLIVGGLNAQKISLVSGDLKSLKEFKDWGVVFDYEGMIFDKKGSETEWLAKTQKEKNTKEAGSGDAFVDDWNDSKEELFPRSFAAGITRVLSKKYSVNFKPSKNGAVATVKTTWAFAGYRNPATGLKPAKITSTITFTNPDGKVLAVVNIVKAQGVPPGMSSFNGVGYKVSERMSASYTTTGMALGKYLKKMTYK